MGNVDHAAGQDVHIEIPNQPNGSKNKKTEPITRFYVIYLTTV